MKLVEHRYPYMKEGLWQGKLDNGLTVFLLPKQDFYETYGLLSTQFGAMDTRYRLPEEEMDILSPEGIAHFLEHKLFESEDGQDVMEKFAQLGASANAYTTLEQTAYLFSTSKNVLPCISLLHELAYRPFFTEENVDRERGIIGQEIDMYQDDPDYRLYIGMLAGLYPQTPLACDIAGTAASISEISADSLYATHRMFYQPHNMTLFLIGQFDLDSVWEHIQSIQEEVLSEPIQVQALPLEKHPVVEHGSEEFEVSQPKLAVGLRGNDPIRPEEVQTYRLSLHLLFSMLIGWTSTRYQTLYEKGKIDSSFQFHLEVTQDYHFVAVTMDTTEPIHLSSLLKKVFRQFASDADINEEHLQLIKQEMYGDFIKGLNSLEWTATYFVSQYAEGGSIFDLPALLESISLDEVVEIGHRFIANCDMTDFTIFPK